MGVENELDWADALQGDRPMSLLEKSSNFYKKFSIADGVSVISGGYGGGASDNASNLGTAF